MFHLILCRDDENIIGINNHLVVNIKKDIERFKYITSESYNDYENIIVMGHNTWTSLKKKTLPNRKNIIITKNHITQFGLNEAFISIDNFIEWYQKNTFKYGFVFIIGGQQIYDEIIKNHSDKVISIYITQVMGNLIGKNINNEIKISKFDHEMKLFKLQSEEVHEDNAMVYDIENNTKINKLVKYKFQLYRNISHINEEEYQYLNHLKIILNSSKKKSRNGTVYSKFGGINMEFDLRKGFPLLTTKKMGWKTILRELLWFISGSTDNKKLVDNRVNIWTQNSIEYEKKSNYGSGDLGPIYGFQWRHFGAEYIGCDQDYTNKGIDQLKWIIDEIKKNPESRRLIMSSWNPVDLSNMALPPCHVLVQFSIEDTYIDAQLYQRSGDMFLGVPYNIASYSYLLSIIGNITGYTPRKLYHVLGDAHIYEEHIDSVKDQLKRTPSRFPRLLINKINDIDIIDEYNFNIVDYISHTSISAPMIT